MALERATEAESGVPPAFPFHMIKPLPHPRGHQLAPWQSSPGLEWAPGTLLYFQEVVKTWAQGGGWLLCRSIDSKRQRMYPLIVPKPESKGMLEVGTLRKWRLQACPEPETPIPGSLVWFCSPSKLLPSSNPWVEQSLKSISPLVGGQIIVTTNNIMSLVNIYLARDLF